MKERDLLRYHGDRGPQAVLAHRTNILVIDQHPSLINIDQPLEQTDQCRFAGARGSD